MRISRRQFPQAAAARPQSEPRGAVRRLSIKHPRRRLLRLGAAAIALPGVARIAWAQAYPARPITMVVPFAAGGATDVTARIIAERMRVTLGQPVIIENVGGAQGSIGVGRVARAAPDGYTIDIGQWDTHVVNGPLYPLGYDLVNDFEPIGLVSTNPYVITGRRTIPANDLQSLVAWLKANPDRTFATPATGSHVAGFYLQKETDTHLIFVPYRGGALAMQDLIAGQVDLATPFPPVALPLMRAGAIKAFAVTSTTRLTVAPEIQTVGEAGLSRLEMLAWFGLFAPKGTPKEIVAKLNAAVVGALATANVRERLAGLGQEIPQRDRQTPEALAAFHRAEVEKWWPIIRSANIKGE